MQLLGHDPGAPETLWIVGYSTFTDEVLLVHEYRSWRPAELLESIRSRHGRNMTFSRVTEEQAHFIQQMQHELHTMVKHGLKKA